MSIIHVNSPGHNMSLSNSILLNCPIFSLFNPDKMEDIERGLNKLRLIKQTPQDRQRNLSQTEIEERIFIFILIRP